MFETSLYHDEIHGSKDVRKQKRNMTLDLNSYDNKKMKMNSLLSSPDIKMLQLASPELERFIIQNTSLSNSTLTTPSGMSFPKFVTKEQEDYARGFCVALEKLHSSKCEEQLSDGIALNTSHASENGVNNLYTNTIASLTSPNNVSTVDAAKLMSLLSGLQNSPNSPFSNMESFVSSSTPKMESKSSLETMISNVNFALTTTSIPTCDSNYDKVTSTDTFYLNVPLHLKEEPQTVPCNTPPISPAPSSVDMDCMNSRPIDMNEQECIKRERKKERNREAARKCRSRKLERISTLEDKIKDYKSEMSSLVEEKETLVKELGSLKQVIMNHVTSGCHTLKSLLHDLNSQL